jgi:hypothetical protein
MLPTGKSTVAEVIRIPQGAPSLGIVPSGDGYLRLTQVQLRTVPLVHLISGVDAEAADPISGSVGASKSSIAGYTEWASLTSPALSLGWDWLLEGRDSELRYLRVDEPRSNIMLLDIHHRDLGPMQTSVALALFVDELAWEQTVAEYVRRRYG